MATETVPADIAAAIDDVILDAKWYGQGPDEGAERDLREARVALETAILAHLRKADEMKVALKMQTSGAA